MNWIAMIGTTLLSLGMGMGMSSDAHANIFLPHACTAQNEGGIYLAKIGPYRHDQSYTIIPYECCNNPRIATARLVCDYNGYGCVQR